MYFGSILTVKMHLNLRSVHNVLESGKGCRQDLHLLVYCFINRDLGLIWTYNMSDNTYFYNRNLFEELNMKYPFSSVQVLSILLHLAFLILYLNEKRFL